MKDLKFFATLGAWIVGYFLLLEFLSPALVATGYAWTWWLVLGAYICSLPVICIWLRESEIRKGAVRRKFEEAHRLTALVALIFAGIAGFLIDPSISPWLEERGLGWVWLVSVAAGLGWIVVQETRLRRKEREERQPEEPLG